METMKMIIKTAAQKEREERDAAILREYRELMAVPGQTKTIAKEYLMKKYRVHSISTMYVILARAEKLVNNGAIL